MNRKWWSSMLVLPILVVAWQTAGFASMYTVFPAGNCVKPDRVTIELVPSESGKYYSKSGMDTNAIDSNLSTSWHYEDFGGGYGQPNAYVTATAEFSTGSVTLNGVFYSYRVSLTDNTYQRTPKDSVVVSVWSPDRGDWIKISPGDTFPAMRVSKIRAAHWLYVWNLAANEPTRTVLDIYEIQGVKASGGGSLTSLPLKESILFGGLANQRGLGISVTGSSLYICGTDAATYPGGQALAANFALPLSPTSKPAWRAAWPTPGSSTGQEMEPFLGVASDMTSAYFAGSSWAHTSDNIGDKESKSVLAKFAVAGPAFRNGVAGCEWVVHPAFFTNYWGWETLNAVASSREGDATYLYVTGRAQTNGANNTAVLAKYTSAGKQVWRLDLGDQGAYKNSNGISLAVSNGRVYVGGTTHYPYTDPSARRAILWSCDLSGSSKYAYSLTKAPGPRGGEVALAAMGSTVFVAESIDNGPDSGLDVFVQKYDFSQSNYLGWSKVYGGRGDEIPHGLAVSSDGKRIYGVGEMVDDVLHKDAVLVEIDANDGKMLSKTMFSKTKDVGGTAMMGEKLAEQRLGQRGQDIIARGVAVVGPDIYVVGDLENFSSPDGNAAGQRDVMLLHYVSGGNQPPLILMPVADAGPDVTIEKDTWGAMAVRLDGSKSYDPNVPALPLTYKWSSNSTLRFSNPADVKPTAYPDRLDTFVITLEASNGKLTAKDSVIIRLQDTVKPVVRVTLTPNTLRPPDNKMVPVTAQVFASDSCDPKPGVTLVSITSNGSKPGQKDTDVAGAAFGTYDTSFSLLASKTQGGDSRIYTIVYEAKDGSKNACTMVATAIVPKNQSGGNDKEKDDDKGKGDDSKGKSSGDTGGKSGDNQNRSGLGDGTNPGQGSGKDNSPNQGTNNPNQSGGSGGSSSDSKKK